MSTDRDNEKRFSGLAVSSGLAIGCVCLLSQTRHNPLPSYQVSEKGLSREQARLRLAITAVVKRLEELREKVAKRIGKAEAEIFIAQKMIVQDSTLLAEMEQTLQRGYNAETAVLLTMQDYETKLSEVDDAYFSERAGDIGELKHRLLDELCDTRPSFMCAEDAKCRRGKDRIVIAEELTASMTLDIHTERVLGFVTERGGKTSHAAILARALGIPAVSGIDNIHNLVPCGTEVLINGETGEVVITPSRQTKADAGGVFRMHKRLPPADPVPQLRVMANISMASEVAEARAMKAEGIGLYRTEFEFFAAGRLLSEQEQFELYSKVVDAMDGQEVYFRLLDLGADKTLPAFDLPAEENPALGCRGARLLLLRPELLKLQARALTRASARGAVCVMYPMVVSLLQFRRLRAIFDEATADLDTANVRHGVMFEVPSACLEAEKLLAEADFASIGSNDLIQYLFAVDRNNEHVADDFSPDSEVFWRLLSDLVAAARKASRPLSLCGELASDTEFTARLLALGIRSVSVSPRHIAQVRHTAAEAAMERKQT